MHIKSLDNIDTNLKIKELNLDSDSKLVSKSLDNIDTNLKIKELNLDSDSSSDSSSNINWDIPQTHGLSNSNQIIPKYYFSNKDLKKINTIDYYEMILDDIRNMRVLNEYQINYIKNKLSLEQKDIIISEYNKCTISYRSFFES